MDNATLLLLLFLGCELFILVAFVVVLIVLPAVKPVQLSEADKREIERANRDKKST